MAKAERRYPELAHFLTEHLSQELSIRSIARRMGINPGTVSRWFSGFSRPRTESQVQQLADILMIRGPALIEFHRLMDYPTSYTVRADQNTNQPHESPAPPVTLPACALPSPVADFVARKEELHKIVTALSLAKRRHRSGEVIISGMAGSGKSQLAYMVAKRLRQSFSTQLQIDLRGSSQHPLKVLDALQTLVSILGSQAAPGTSIDEARARYLYLLKQQPTLIVLDDAYDAQQVELLLPPVGSVVIITSRQVFTLPNTTLPPIHIEGLPTADAAKLLITICPRIGEYADVLAALCGNIPLALRLSGMFLLEATWYAVDDYLHALQDEQRRLDMFTDPDHPERSVRAAFQVSYDRLQSAAQHVFAQLSIFRGSFAGPAAHAIIHLLAQETPTPHIAAPLDQLLHSLLRRNLLIYDASRRRYILHDLVRIFSWEQNGQDDALALRHARYYGQTLKRVRELFLQAGESFNMALRLFDEERREIDAAWEWLAQQPEIPELHDLILLYVHSIATIAELRYAVDTIIEALRRGIAIAEHSQNQSQGSLFWCLLGHAYRTANNFHAALAAYETSLALVQSTGDMYAEGRAYGGIGLALYFLGRGRESVTAHERYLQIARATGRQRAEGNALNNLGISYLLLGEYAHARQLFEQALEINRTVGTSQEVAAAIGNIGIACYRIGDYQEAIDSFTEQLTIARTVGDRDLEARALIEMSGSYLALGNVEMASDLGKQGHRCATEANEDRTIADALRTIGKIFCQLNQVAEAIEKYLKPALELDRKNDNKPNISESLHALGAAYLKLGAVDRARECYEEALTIDQEVGDPVAAQRAMEQLAILARMTTSEEGNVRQR